MTATTACVISGHKSAEPQAADYLENNRHNDSRANQVITSLAGRCGYSESGSVDILNRIGLGPIAMYKNNPEATHPHILQAVMFVFLPRYSESFQRAKWFRTPQGPSAAEAAITGD